MIVTINIHDLTDELLISYTQTIEYFAILDSEANSSIISYTDSMTDDEGVEERNELLSFKIDDIDVSLEDCSKEVKEIGRIKYIHEVPIKGKNSFKVYLKIKNTYSLKGENVKLLKFNTITKNVDVTVAHAKNVQVTFFSVGLINDFEEIHTDIENTLSRRHRKGLFLPKQGFGLSFNKI
ncbi:hypothetical protein [Sphingobacterium sp. IITKGP-BTPF85]|uniref:hypothetical protein n=1 Tax=Sphingobacterium sp. IITKGP-BTPF85 TaxID=1338009 RepID=UPI00038A3543|nr:hypothetical protein [Sphingobacterium sp. IITKGP-BTPF85]KKX48753.1 hypothetical protein L950_0219435 [Sphingobacterium sp. IITKGP-BTPF85]